MKKIVLIKLFGFFLMTSSLSAGSGVKQGGSCPSSSSRCVGTDPTIQAASTDTVNPGFATGESCGKGINPQTGAVDIDCGGYRLGDAIAE